MKGATPCLAGLALAVAPLAAATKPDYQSAGRSAMSVHAIYAERCGGCHGLDGRSAAAAVPDLVGRAGYFLCTAGSRDFAGRLPNITFARLSDADLAAVMNYVTRDMQPAAARIAGPAYTEADMARLREQPLSVTDLHARRRRIVEEMIKRCDAPRGLLDYGHPAAPAGR